MGTFKKKKNHLCQSTKVEFAQISKQTKSIYSEERILLTDHQSIHMKSFL